MDGKDIDRPLLAPSDSNQESGDFRPRRNGMTFPIPFPDGDPGMLVRRYFPGIPTLLCKKRQRPRCPVIGLGNAGLLEKAFVLIIMMKDGGGNAPLLTFASHRYLNGREVTQPSVSFIVLFMAVRIDPVTYILDFLSD